MNGQLAVGDPASGNSHSVAAAPSGTRTKFLIAAVPVLLGLGGFAHQLDALWRLWTTDPLRSFGMLLPLAAIGIGFRQFQASDWEGKGSWWGFVAMTATVVLALSSTNHLFFLSFLFSGHLLLLNVLPNGVLLWGYFAGAVALFGGHQALRRHRFALALLLFVNPVPSGFTTLADLPLQAVGAQTARGFAQWLGVAVNGDALKLMFSPHLGMFVAPGCDGMRGAVALGYMALIVGNLQRMKYGTWAAFVVVGVLLAYVFNLLRLCGVILYYWLALRIPAISGSGTEVDYCIGGILFFCAASFLIGVPRRLKARA